MYSLEEVFNQSNEDRYAARLNGVGYVSNTLFGVKIIRDNITSIVEILQLKYIESYYLELTEDQIKIFLDNGWRHGVYVVALSEYRLELDFVENKIKDILSRKGNKKNVRIHKDRRAEVLKKYTEINNKLNKLKTSSY